ncbi:outer membrane biogenesis protein BamB [Legionella birminghamensis]|uniref:Outer membrane biogenesis protein BamB n=2 Tax=Legionella birminghamensis TaxID=28083 RepID=A0A378I9R6_9GAMM|nr:PQQ-binding-like beta-propeller repeat protein [Legionella birminghamensis]KTC67940.1 outer membrane biogenesis protein BamB [Legionella birminghamensis]STX31351.1 outer membrane biogenesis protein BamB [Legionella birminghamensis]
MLASKLWKLGAVSAGLLVFSFSYSKPSQAVDTSIWGMYQGNAAHTGYVPIVIDTAKIKQIWSVDVGQDGFPGMNTEIHQASIGHKYVFVSRYNYGQANSLEAFSFEDGHVVWSVDLNHLAVQPSAYSDGVVYVQTVYGDSRKTRLWAFDENSGEYLFSSQFLAEYQSYKAPVIDNDKVYASGGFRAGIVAFNAHKAGRLWFTHFDRYGEEATAAVNEKYVLYYNACVMYKLDKNTGDILSKIQDDYCEWKRDYDPTPVLFGNDFAFVTSNQYLTKFNLAEDKVEFAINNVSSNPSVDDKKVYVIKDSQLTAINAETGDVVWSIDASDFRKVEDLVVTKNLVFVSDRKKTRAYSKSKKHELVWQADVGGKLSLSSKGLFIVSHSGTLTAFNINADYL